MVLEFWILKLESFSHLVCCSQSYHMTPKELEYSWKRHFMTHLHHILWALQLLVTTCFCFTKKSSLDILLFSPIVLQIRQKSQKGLEGEVLTQLTVASKIHSCKEFYLFHRESQHHLIIYCEQPVSRCHPPVLKHTHTRFWDTVVQYGNLQDAQIRTDW